MIQWLHEKFETWKVRLLVDLAIVGDIAVQVLDALQLFDMSTFLDPRVLTALALLRISLSFVRRSAEAD